MKVTPQPPLCLGSRKALDGQVVSSPSALALTGNAVTDLRSIAAAIEEGKLLVDPYTFGVRDGKITVEMALCPKTLS